MWVLVWVFWLVFLPALTVVVRAVGDGVGEDDPKPLSALVSVLLPPSGSLSSTSICGPLLVVSHGGGHGAVAEGAAGGADAFGATVDVTSSITAMAVTMATTMAAKSFVDDGGPGAS